MKIALFVLLLGFIKANGQNLISNPSFEKFNQLS